MLTDCKRLTSPPHTMQQHLCVCVCVLLSFSFFLLLYIFLTLAVATEATESSKATLLNVNRVPECIELKEQVLLRVLQQSSTIVSEQIRQV